MDDHVQDTFLRFFRMAKDLRDPSLLSSFIVGIAVRVARAGPRRVGKRSRIAARGSAARQTERGGTASVEMARSWVERAWSGRLAVLRASSALRGGVGRSGPGPARRHATLHCTEAAYEAEGAAAPTSAERTRSVEWPSIRERALLVAAPDLRAAVRAAGERRLDLVAGRVEHARRATRLVFGAAGEVVLELEVVDPAGSGVLDGIRAFPRLAAGREERGRNENRRHEITLAHNPALHLATCGWRGAGRPMQRGAPEADRRCRWPLHPMENVGEPVWARADVGFWLPILLESGEG
ncbi:hypothetical protein [Sorangium sp. So ce1335]|uniref:hypothetical protein n=1 Tax=Sorangium sp. So ce1335 TaxID=3133335 RepID=UPI003F5DCC29